MAPMCHEPSARRPGSRARWWYHHDVASIVDLTDPAAVQTALNEYDQVGADAFLAKYGFGPARSYFVVRDGKRYDSKAIVGVAYGYQHPAEGPLGPTDFSGGEKTVWRLLRGLGFEVTGVDEQELDAAPTSDRDELEARAAALQVAAQRQARALPRPDGNRSPPRVRDGDRVAFKRDVRVVAYVRQRANGRCELCGNDAPFETDAGVPYLEVHHVEMLCDGGADGPDNAAALCPNCHRLLHYGRTRSSHLAELYTRVPELIRPTPPRSPR